MMNNRSLARAVLWCPVVALCLHPVVFAGSISYPALGNIDLERGTIEMWLIPQFDVVEGELVEREYWGFNLFEIESSDDTFVSIIWRIRSGRSGPFARHRFDGFRVPVNWHVVDDWKEGEPRHVAYCWEGDRDWWIVDGEKREPTRSGLDVRVHERLEMVLGSAVSHGRFVIDDLRISSIPRTPEEVGYHKPGQLEPDYWTLLLDTFDDPFECDGVRQTSPKTMMPSVDGQTGGVPDEHCEFVPGVSGTGLRL